MQILLQLAQLELVIRRNISYWELLFRSQREPRNFLYTRIANARPGPVLRSSKSLITKPVTNIISKGGLAPLQLNYENKKYTCRKEVQSLNFHMTAQFTILSFEHWKVAQAGIKNVHNN